MPDYNAEALVGLTCSSYAAESLVARQLNLDLGGFRVADIAGNPHVIERAPQLIRERPKDAVFASLLLDGQAFFYHAGGCLTLGAGDVIVYETDAPYLFGFSSAMRQVLIDVPRRVFHERCAPALRGPLKVAAVDAGTAAAAARTLRQMLLGLVEDPVVAPHSTGDHLLDLLETMTTGRGRRPAPPACCQRRSSSPITWAILTSAQTESRTPSVSPHVTSTAPSPLKAPRLPSTSKRVDWMRHRTSPTGVHLCPRLQRALRRRPQLRIVSKSGQQGDRALAGAAASST